MQRPPSHFDDYYRQRLAVEQRRAVLEVLANELDPDTTIGEVIDAAEDIGWGDGLGELCLAELAGVLVPEVARVDAAPAAAGEAVLADEEDEFVVDDEEDDLVEEDEETEEDDGEDEVDEEDEDEDEDEEEEAPVPRGRARKVSAKKASAKKASAKKASAKKASAKKASAKKTSAKKASAKKASAKKASAKKASAKKASAKKTSAKKTSAKKASAKKASAKKASAKKASAKKAAAAELDSEAMSLDQAAKVLLPLVRRHKEATMQALEESTGMGRRKLRFHIGQLVKHGRLRRHGMGRGTYYTVVR